MNDRSKVERRDAARLAVLRAIYDLTDGGRSGVFADASDIAEATGIPDDEVEDAYRFLEGEDFTELLADHVGITHKGRKEVERTIRDPKGETGYFQPVVVQMSQTFHAPVGVVQTGNHNVANVTQNVQTQVQIDARKQIAELRQEAAKLKVPDAREEAEEILVVWDEGIEKNDAAIVKSADRKGRRLQELFTGENLKTAAGLVSPVVELIKALLEAAQ